MTRTQEKLAAQLLSAARQAAKSAEVSEAQRKRLAICAVEAVRAEAWGAVDAASAAAPADVQEHVRDALEYAVEHPVLVGTNGKAYNGRLFVLPVSQAIQGTAALAYLPQGEVVQRLLTEALCPGGVGILLNRLLPEAAIAKLSLKDIWTMTNMAFERVEPGSAEAQEPLFIELTGGESSGLHFVVFMAFATGSESDTLLGLEGDDLAVRSLAVMGAINPLITEACVGAGQFGVQACLHLPQSFFYDPPVVDLAHEAFLFAVELNQWVASAEEEGRKLTLRVDVEPGDDHQDVVVRALDGKTEFGSFYFAVDLGDEEMLAEVCLSVEQIAGPHDVPVALPSGVRIDREDADDGGALSLAYIDGPSTLQ